MRRAPPAAISGVSSPRYQRRTPENTLLYSIVAGHLETFLAEARDHDRHGLPRYVERELRAYLKCGILAHGFFHATCKSCGAEIVVAFSCKRRGVCPSCNARRMCSTAAHLVDSVFPDVPVRQWVLSVPYELRLTLARRADAFGALIRIFDQEVLRFLERASGVRGAKGGGVSFPQRFGGSLNLNTHVHAVFPDGVFVRESASARAEFVRVSPPTPLELSALCERIHARFVRWLGSRGLLRTDEHASNDRPESSCIDSCTEAAIGIGTLASVDDGSATDGEAAAEQANLPRARKGKHVGEALGFSIHAGVAVPAGNVLGRELLLRYCGRPPLALERLSVLPDGRIAYRLKTPWRKDQTHRVMTPVELIARLAALVPPPRHPLIRFHGVLAPHSGWRASVVPEPRSSPQPRCDVQSPARRPSSASTPARAADKKDGPASKDEAELKPGPPPVAAPASSSSATPEKPAPVAVRKSWWIDWATLLRRVYDIDALQCSCGGRLRFVEVVDDRKAAAVMLRALGFPPEPPDVARARDPTPDFDPSPLDTHVDAAHADDFDPPPPTSW
ncbi:MAG: transposase [Myxococcales bacterium]|nr:transposase [Myxococcales bacterium]